MGAWVHFPPLHLHYAIIQGLAGYLSAVYSSLEIHETSRPSYRMMIYLKK